FLILVVDYVIDSLVHSVPFYCSKKPKNALLLKQPFDVALCENEFDTPDVIPQCSISKPGGSVWGVGSLLYSLFAELSANMCVCTF
uniref:Uncharacterized protein n=1 Tax=Periophthalmus magnuspinnatus TaxID=409849 RepID=A0A3B4B4N0_9GOBI